MIYFTLGHEIMGLVKEKGTLKHCLFQWSGSTSNFPVFEEVKPGLQWLRQLFRLQGHVFSFGADVVWILSDAKTI